MVSDKNLSAEPINLYYATRKEGPWLAVAKNLKNDGLYRWQFPRDAGGQFFFRVEATDLAGNTARGETTTAVMLDLTEPRASVIGVNAVRAPAGMRTPNSTRRSCSSVSLRSNSRNTCTTPL